MGNTSAGSSATDHHQPAKHRSPEADPSIMSAFNSLSDGGSTIGYKQFKGKFDEPLATALWRHLHGSAPSGNEEMSPDDFSKHCRSLAGMSTDIYIQILMPARNLLNVCFQCAGVDVQPSDETFINSLVDDMVSAKLSAHTSNGGDTAESVIAWKNSTCPRLCQCVQQRVTEVFSTQTPTRKETVPSCGILSPVQMFVLLRCLPTTVYFPGRNSYQPSSDSDEEWIRLYSSAEQGTSINRFETNVFDYKGSTVCIFKLTHGGVYAVALDQAWRHSLKKFGGPNTILLQFHPKFMRIDSGDSPVLYCNFKNRSSAYGITFGRHLSIDGEFTNVAEAEAWGCAGVEALEEQKKQKVWQKRQAQKHSTVPRNWDDNPDKAVLEMAGFTFSAERRDERPPDER